MAITPVTPHLMFARQIVAEPESLSVSGALIDVNYSCRPCCLTQRCYQARLFVVVTAQRSRGDRARRRRDWPIPGVGSGGDVDRSSAGCLIGCVGEQFFVERQHIRLDVGFLAETALEIGAAAQRRTLRQ